ncbi:MAG: MarR family transcriptional regulator [Parcubacteria group bacterium]|jgi:DNA-binding MarR family transcriptional regulator
MKKEDATNQAVSLIFSLGRQIKERFQNERKGWISGMNLEVLRYIREHKPLMKDIADYLCVTPPSATSLVNNLVNDKLAERVYDEEDRRVVRLQITVHGKNELMKGKERIADRMKKILSSLSKKEKEDLIRILEKISNNN